MTEQQHRDLNSALVGIGLAIGALADAPGSAHAPFYEIYLGLSEHHGAAQRAHGELLKQQPAAKVSREKLVDLVTRSYITRDPRRVEVQVDYTVWLMRQLGIEVAS